MLGAIRGRRAPSRDLASARGRAAAEPGLLTGLHPVREALRRAGVPEAARSARGAAAGVGRAARAGAGGGGPVVERLAAALGDPGRRARPLGLARGRAAAGARAGGQLRRRRHLRRATLVALDGVEDPQNLGAIVRVAEAAGRRGLVLTRRHAPPLSDAVSRASAGAIEWLPVCRVPNLTRALGALKDAGFWVLGADPSAERDLISAPDAWLARTPGPGARGGGRRAPSGRDREALDHRVRIPMQGQVASLNVSTACAVFLFEIRRREATAGSAETRCPRGDHNL